MFKALVLSAFLNLALTAPTDLDYTPINKFTLKLLENTYLFGENFGRKNVALSPLSIWNIFALLAEGSTGDTYTELVKSLHLPDDLRSTQALHSTLKNILHSKDPHVTIQGRTAMFSDSNLQIHREFCHSALSYDTDVYQVDANNTSELAKNINYYICVATEGRIPKAVQEDMLEDLVMILVDALYFKATWTYPFDPTQTREESFYNSQGKTIGSVNMMFHKAPHSIGDSTQIGAQILEMTYGKQQEFAMLILLPFDGMPIKKLLANLANQNLDWMTEFKSGGNLPEIECFIPRFRLSSRSDLKVPLQYSGIQSIFEPKKAQLPGVSDSPLFVSKTIQNVEIEVNEEGTVAAAATVVGLEDRILGQRFEANREFVFLIVERKSKVILFAGVYGEPSVI